jgi:hypothetical protein
MSIRHVAIALSLALAPAAETALAAGHHGGGSSGHSHSGSGGARGSYSGASSSSHWGGGHASGARSYSSGRSRAEGHHFGSRIGRYGYGYRYDRYGYRAYYRPRFSTSFYLGWPYYSAPYDYGYYGPYYGRYYGGYYSNDYPTYPYDDSDDLDDDPGGVDQAAPPEDAGPAGQLRLAIKPADAVIYLDNEFLGTARGVGVLRLPPGQHAVEVARPGFQSVARRVVIESGKGSVLTLDLAHP